MFRTVLSAMRIEQWYKNIVIFVGIVFSLNISNISMLIRTALAFWIFCFLSSGVYLINDLHDVEKDRWHPVKKNRPLSSGRISINLAASLAVLFLLVSLSSALILGNLFFVICLFYLIQSLLYTFYLRRIVIVDVIVIALGFVWRAIAGTVVINVRTSPWLIICSFLLALFLALNKRQMEMKIMFQAEEYRKTLGVYSKQVIDMFLNITTATLLVAYMIYTFECGHIYMMTTIPFAFIGIFRYVQLARQIEDINNEATFIFKDKLTLINVLLWAAFSIVALYDVLPPFVEFLSGGMEG